MQTKFDAIVIGAGPAGSSAAILLSRAGWNVALVEKQIFPRLKVCGECIAASNLPLLDALGIGAALRANAGAELSKIAIMHRDQIIVSNLPEALDERYPLGMALSRETLDTLLLEQARLSGTQVLQPYSVKSIEGKAGDWSCTVKASESNALFILQAPVLIGAHGSWEAIHSDRPQRRLERKASDLFAFKANFSNVTLDNSLLSVLSFKGGYGGIVVGGDGITTLACCMRRDRIESCRLAMPNLRIGTVVEALLKRECKGVQLALKGAILKGRWLTVGPLDPGVRLWTKDEMFRIGNAAGEAHPIIGEGMSMAIQSAWLLCAHLLKSDRNKVVNSAQLQHDIQRLYIHDWRKQFLPRMRLATALAHIAMQPYLAQPLITIAKNWPSLMTLGAKLAGKVHCPVEQDMISLHSTISDSMKKSNVSYLGYMDSLESKRLYREKM